MGVVDDDAVPLGPVDSKLGLLCELRSAASAASRSRCSSRSFAAATSLIRSASCALANVLAAATPWQLLALVARPALSPPRLP